MPHAGLMDERELGPVEGPLLRARMHIRGGRRRLRQGKISAGVATLYDALSAALQWYLAKPKRKKMIWFNKGEDRNNDRIAYLILVRSGILDGSFDFDAFDRLLERALQEELTGIDHHAVLAGIESVLSQLGVLPFDEASLPPEDPGTF